MNVVLISCYDLGRQPFGLAQPAARLRDSGFPVRCLDLAVEPLDRPAVGDAGLVAIHVPMHTATRLALDLVPEILRLNRSASLCFFGLYAAAAPGRFRAAGVDTLLAGEFEDRLVELAERLRGGDDGADPPPLVSTGKQEFVLPDRSGLPPLDRYAKLRIGEEERIVGYTEASRGCRHVCRHCPVVPVYGGRFRIVPAGIVLQDVRNQVAAGARHVTFGDPDFFNAPGHSLPIVEALHGEFPDLTWDATIKVEHLVRYRRHLPALKRDGCLFVTSAAESLDDRILGLLDKGHTREEFVSVVHDFQELGLGLSPTWIPFTPWTTVGDYRFLLETLERLRLVDAVAPVQLSLRLLVPPHSRFLEVPEVRRAVGPLDEERLLHPWRNPDPEVDRLQAAVERLVARHARKGTGRREIFRRIRREAAGAAGLPIPAGSPAVEAVPAAAVPSLTEPWYC